MDKDVILKKISQAIHQKDREAEVYLFGSRARGDSYPDSDWDLLILVNAPKVTNEIEDQFRDGLYEIELELGQIISAFIYPKDFWKNNLLYSPLYKNVTREGVRLWRSVTAMII